MSGSLGVWMNGERVGQWAVTRGGVHTLTYAPEWLRSSKVRSLSLSLPITPSREVRGAAVSNYFDNLLPDNDRIRERLGHRFRTRDVSPFSLLQAIGRDCVGAVQLLPDGTEPEGWDRIDAEPLSETELRDLIDAVSSDTALGLHGGPADDDLFRISLAGAQEKTALTRVGRRWCRPHGATPTTHIVKLPLGLVGGSRRVDLSDSLENEWLCAHLLAALGLPVAPTEMAEFGGRKVLVVERFDREWMDGRRWIARLPQEDLCQALGQPPGKKYERDGGPGMSACLGVLAGSASAESDRMLFQLAQLAFWLLAATDGHAKNFSIFLRQGDSYTMTPLYDVISVWPYVGDAANQIPRKRASLAMALRGKSVHYALQGIEARHWHALATKHGGAQVWQAMCALVSRVEGVIAAVKPPRSFPARTWDRVTQGMRAQARRFEAGAATLEASTP